LSDSRSLITNPPSSPWKDIRKCRQGLFCQTDVLYIHLEKILSTSERVSPLAWGDWFSSNCINNIPLSSRIGARWIWTHEHTHAPFELPENQEQLYWCQVESMPGHW
jgi:hypothetical protein